MEEQVQKGVNFLPVKSSWTTISLLSLGFINISTSGYFFLQSIEIASMKEVRKVKSVQMFKRPVQRASQGDRVGMCVTQFDAKLLERGIACAPGYVTTIHGGVIDMVDGATCKNTYS